MWLFHMARLQSVQFRVLCTFKTHGIHALLVERYYHLAFRMMESRQTDGYLEYSVGVV